MWLAENNAILTKDNLIKRNWTGSPSCYFCQEEESVNHLFFLCPIAKTIWGIFGLCVGGNTIPNDFHQYRTWISHWLPGGETFTPVVVLLCAGPSGNAEIRHALTRK